MIISRCKLSTSRSARTARGPAPVTRVWVVLLPHTPTKPLIPEHSNRQAGRLLAGLLVCVARGLPGEGLLAVRRVWASEIVVIRRHLIWPVGGQAVFPGMTGLVRISPGNRGMGRGLLTTQLVVNQCLAHGARLQGLANAGSINMLCAGCGCCQ